jgi:SM-20-related protein
MSPTADPPPRHVFVASDALTATDCERVRSAMATGVSHDAEVLDEASEIRQEARRAADVDVPEDVLALVESCLDSYRDAIGAFHARALHEREGAGFLRYDAGGFYGPHVDRADLPSWPDAAQRSVTVVLFLNSSQETDAAGDFTGGRLRIFPAGPSGAAVDIAPTRGLLVAFPAEMVHEVTVVTSGRRDAVIDWFYEARNANDSFRLRDGSSAAGDGPTAPARGRRGRRKPARSGARRTPRRSSPAWIPCDRPDPSRSGSSRR